MTKLAHTIGSIRERKMFRHHNNNKKIVIIIIITYHDFLHTPRRGSHVKSDKTHTQS